MTNQAELRNTLNELADAYDTYIAAWQNYQKLDRFTTSARCVDIIGGVLVSEWQNILDATSKLAAMSRELDDDDE